MTLELCLVFFFSPFVIKMYLHDLFVRFCFMCLLFIFFPNMRVIYSFSFFSYFEERKKPMGCTRTNVKRLRNSQNGLDSSSLSCLLIKSAR